jgi:hypothetical protein
MPINIVPKNDDMEADDELDQFGGFSRKAVKKQQNGLLMRLRRVKWMIVIVGKRQLLAL